MLDSSKAMGDAMRYCDICSKLIEDGEKIHMGIVSTFKKIPSQVSFAVEKPERFTFVNHAVCDGLGDSDE